MQAVSHLTVKQLDALIDGLFELERPEVVSSDSEFGKKLEKFASAASMKSRIARAIKIRAFFFNFAIRYPSAGGRIENERVRLDPKACHGHTFRYSAGGWGIINLQLDFASKPKVECRVTANSRKRALLWEVHDPKWAPVSAWNWPVVEKRTRHLIRRLKDLARS